jgi:hypothetical protein
LFPLGYLFFTFDQWWLKAKPADVMEFNHVRDEFVADLTERLKNPSVVLRWNPIVDEL